MKIGNIEIKNNIMLAPMAGVTDYSYRHICKEMGAGVVVTEMISAKAMLYGNKNTIPLLKTDDFERPVGVQIFGSDPDIMADMALRLEETENYDFIDINMGCPVPKVVNNGEGSGLMKNPVLAGKIVETMTDKLTIPVTVKFRKGFDKDNINGIEFAKIMEESGASAVTLHGRTREQYYSGNADYDYIKKVKESINIPLIGNGDVHSVREANELMKYTGCDGVMIGRAARGNPWIFTGAEDKPDRKEVFDMILRHAKMMIEDKGEYSGIREMRKHVAWYTQGMRGCVNIRRQVNYIESYKDLEECLSKEL